MASPELKPKTPSPETIWRSKIDRGCHHLVHQRNRKDHSQQQLGERRPDDPILQATPSKPACKEQKPP
uniref:Uncharacterized protein n=1 Tax=Arundo donax TaxID=35708 RepID=A0A0A9HCI1_ARUDO